MLKWIVLLHILIVFSAATTLLNTENAFAVDPKIKFDQTQIVLEHSDYVTLSDDTLGTIIEVYVDGSNPLRTTGDITLTLDYRNHYRTLVEFNTIGSSSISSPTLDVNAGETVKAKIKNTTIEDSANIIDGLDPPPNYPNKVSFSTKPTCVQGDADGDGICKEWELNDRIEIDWDVDPSKTFIYKYDCDAEDGGNSDSCTDDHKDIFVEFDSMQSHTLNQEAIEEIKTSFKDNGGIFFHYQLDSSDTKNILHDEGTSFPGSNRSGKEGFNQMKAPNFGTPCERANNFSTSCDNESLSTSSPTSEWTDEGYFQKKAMFHYGLSVHTKKGSSATGIAEVKGNDFMISLGAMTSEGMLGSYDTQEGTIMHEIGHNLDLRHGGFENTNCKPNYLSVMSYSRQTSTLFDEKWHRSIDYSHDVLGDGTLPDELDKELLNESLGLKLYPAQPDDHIIFGSDTGTLINNDLKPGLKIDWDHDGDNTEIDSVENINRINAISDCASPSIDEALIGHDDWANIELDFKDHTSNYSDGNPSSTSIISIPGHSLVIPGIPDNRFFDRDSICFSPDKLKNKIIRPFNLFSNLPEKLPNSILEKFIICEGGPKASELMLNKIDMSQDSSMTSNYAEQSVHQYGLKKSEGVYLPKFGSDTSKIVCGDKLCKDIVKGVNLPIETLPETLEAEIPSAKELIFSFENEFFTTEGLTAEDQKNMRILRVNILEKFIDDLDSKDFGKGGEDNRSIIKEQYSIVKKFIKKDMIFNAITTLQEIDYERYIENEKKRAILQEETNSVVNTFSIAVPEFGEIVLLILIPILLVIVVVSRLNKLSLRMGFVSK